MAAIFTKIIMDISYKLLTERVISKLIVYSMVEVAKKTTNNLDNKIVESVAKALNVPLS